jgi:hypothetical protein
MQNPASPPKYKRICPTCNRPVEPGFKFCETCGTRIPELPTCRICGAEFITPVPYCEWCGAPVIPEDEPETDDSPEDNEEENTGQAEDQEPEPGEEEIPVDDDEEQIVPEDEETPHHHKKELPEPDTDELLDTFGEEYAEDETLESFHKPKPETVDEALFLSPGKPKAPAKSRVNKTWIIGACIVLTAIIAIVYFIGLPMLSVSGGFGVFGNPPVVEITPLPTIVRTMPPTLTVTPTPATGALIPQPTQLIPSGQKFYFNVQKNPVTFTISVIFTGSAGEGSIRSADITITHPDGSVSTGIIQPLKGVNEITLKGSKEADRVEIIAQMSSGEKYRVYDKLISL